MPFFLDNNAIPDEQFGFLPGRSTLWQLLQVLEGWQHALDVGGTIHALFLDVAKAFDRVDHGLLLSKLRSAGLGSTALKWIASYLDGRRICTSVDNVTSDFKPISSGVPQGSIMGPLLFLIYFRDIPSVVASTTAKFADDTLLYDAECDCCEEKPAASRTCTVVSDVSTLSRWAKEWNTVFNAAKSANIIVSRRWVTTAAAPLSMDDTVIPRPSVSKHLGVLLSDRLSWADHVKFLLSKVQPKVALLRWMTCRLRLPAFVIERCYLTLVRPILEYAGPAWNGCRVVDTTTLEKLQLRIARSVLRQRGAGLSNSAVLQCVRWPTLAWRRRLQSLCLFWKLQNNLGPPSLSAAVPASASQRASRYSLRKPANLAFPSCSSRQHLKSFIPFCVALWNDLPAPIQSSPSLSSFRCSVIDHFTGDLP